MAGGRREMQMKGSRCRQTTGKHGAVHVLDLVGSHMQMFEFVLQL